jgi:hypothetical protein
MQKQAYGLGLWWMLATGLLIGWQWHMFHVQPPRPNDVYSHTQIQIILIVGTVVWSVGAVAMVVGYLKEKRSS